ncbi:MAG: DUF6062 family protein [Candidatus Atribacteria bacterium]|nr:DUF6062 family protein [Candidatus Atribacteria bacterium]
MDNIFFDLTFFDLKELFQQSGCPICALVQVFEERYLDVLFYENVNDPYVRGKIRDNGGFCPEHIKQIFDTRPSVLGISIIYDDLFRHYLDQALTRDNQCPMCNARKEKEAFIQSIMEKHWKKLKMDWGDRVFLCRRHLEHTPWKEEIRCDLIELSRQSLLKISQDLSSFIRKFDYRIAKDTITNGESSSWQEVLEFFSGERLRRKATNKYH